MFGVEGIGFLKFKGFSGPKLLSAAHRSAALAAADVLPWIACFGRLLDCDESVESA